eukprot:TRINITY_DN2624_c0_g1_i4.p2 TRINITY_DN2624_c0_g1~~TRINITY_DN2624_c0_g1_i4.p2  ORF type:complete len:175 (-),score=74.62 TRINITY_DN2624_c0_g1_i4:358-840(-)
MDQRNGIKEGKELRESKEVKLSKSGKSKGGEGESKIERADSARMGIGEGGEEGGGKGSKKGGGKTGGKLYNTVGRTKGENARLKKADFEEVGKGGKGKGSKEPVENKFGALYLSPVVEKEEKNPGSLSAGRRSRKSSDFVLLTELILADQKQSVPVGALL